MRGQGYNGASVMSGEKGGVKKKMNDHIKSKGVDSPVAFATLTEIYNFFGQSLNRWALTENTVHKLKRLCTTRWSSRIDSVRAATDTLASRRFYRG